MDSGNASAYHSLGILANQADKPELAVSMIEQAVSVSPELASAYYNLGVALAKTGRKDEAIVSYEHALSLTQNDRGRFIWIEVLVCRTGSISASGWQKHSQT